MIPTTAQASAARAAVRAWGQAVGGAVDDVARGLRSESPTTLAEGLATLRPVPRELVHRKGWELRHAFVWRNDDRCVQRAALAAMSLAEAGAGDLRAAVGELATADARRAAIAVTYSPNFQSSMGTARMHAAAVVRTTDGETLVIDHLFADAEDGVLTLREWMRRVGGRDETTTIINPLRQPPLSLRGGPGIPAFARARSAEDWNSFGAHLAASWDESASRGLPQLQRIR